MKRTSIHIAKSTAFALLLASGAVNAQTAVNGPYYATPSWDQTLPAASRFLVLSNMDSAAVLDRETGLVWQRTLQPEATFASATGKCNQAYTGGRFGWRLPTVAELTSLFELTGTTLPSFPVGHPFTGFPATGTLLLWTSTAFATDSSLHYIVQNSLGSPPSLFASAGFANGSSIPYLCVRSSKGG